MQALELSEIRKNMMKWYPFSEEDTCLVVGDEKGLLRQALEGNVRSIHHVVSGEEPDGEQRYHYILLYDGWNPSILPGLRDRLCPGGRILILTDNRLGLRYLPENRIPIREVISPAGTIIRKPAVREEGTPDQNWCGCCRKQDMTGTGFITLIRMNRL